MSKPLNICEIFGPTIQGEGALMGRPTIFVRSGGCDYRCSWCDTMYAVDPKHNGQWQKMTPLEVMKEIERLSDATPMHVTLSGGNPAMQPFADLLDLGHDKGYSFSMETQGSLCRDWFAKLDQLTLSPKGPTSGMETDWTVLDDCVKAAGTTTEVSLKVVIFDDSDYAYAQQVGARYPELALYLQAGNHMVDSACAADIPGVLERLRWLAEKVASDRWQSACVLPQLHVLAWGNMRGA